MSNTAVSEVIDCMRVVLNDDVDIDSGLVPEWSDSQLAGSIKATLAFGEDFAGLALDEAGENFTSVLSAEEFARISLISSKRRILGRRVCNYKTRALSFSESDNSQAILAGIEVELAGVETICAAADSGSEFSQYVRNWRYQKENVSFAKETAVETVVSSSGAFSAILTVTENGGNVDLETANLPVGTYIYTIQITVKHEGNLQAIQITGGCSLAPDGSSSTTDNFKTIMSTGDLETPSVTVDFSLLDLLVRISDPEDGYIYAGSVELVKTSS